jgi:hypothetical protein
MKTLTLALALIAAAAVAPASAAPATATSVPIVGSGPGSTFTGTLNLTRFATQNGALVAVGTLTGSLTNTATGVVTSIVQTVSLPAAVTNPTCPILHLDLGPLSIDLLGLHVDLSRVVLDITAEAGAGNLLGNLLCSVANLLNDPSGLARVLNQILALL